MKFFISILITLAITLTGAEAQQKKSEKEAKVDARKKATGKKVPEKDPALAPFGIYAKTAPMPRQVTPATTSLPLKLNPGMKICYVGNTLLDREGSFGHFEAMIQQQFTGLNLKVRNLSWPADEVDLQPRPDNFASMDQHLAVEKADVIFAAFGFNESFAGEGAIPAVQGTIGRHAAAHEIPCVQRGDGSANRAPFAGGQRERDGRPRSGPEQPTPRSLHGRDEGRRERGTGRFCGCI
jgi:hypothetical protein